MKIEITLNIPKGCDELIVTFNLDGQDPIKIENLTTNELPKPTFEEGVDDGMLKTY